MKVSRLFNRIYLILALLLVFVNLINKHYIANLPLDYLLFAGIVALAVVYGILQRKFEVPRTYLWLLGAFVVLMIFNSLISPYAPPLLYSALGGMITLLPFLFFLASYNFRMEEGEIRQFIRGILLIVCFYLVVLYVDTLFLHTARSAAAADSGLSENALISSNLIRFGDFSSLCNQALVLCLAEFYRTRKREYWYLIAVLAVTIILTNQLKAIAGMALVFSGWLLYLTRVPKWLKAGVVAVGVAALALVLSVSSLFTNKLDQYVENALNESASEEIARPALYYASAEIALDHFPLGSGQGTFGSVPANMIDSPVYEEYELNAIWGLSLDDEVNFRMDTHWASVLGETGVLGLILYLLLFFYPARRMRREVSLEADREERADRFMVRMGVITLFVESLVLALPKSFSFIAIYAGLAALILRRYRPQSPADSPDDPAASEA